MHVTAGAKLTPFGGWEMPLSYPTGTVAEHLACRNGVAVFDVSHLGTIRVTGRGAFEILQRTLTNDLARISSGRAQYSHLLDPSDASVLDDVIVWWVSERRFDVMPNASNTSRLTDALAEVVAQDLGSATIEDVTAQRAVIAVQGPGAAEVMARVSPGTTDLRRFEVRGATVAEVPCVVAATGYTGEAGVEIAVPADRAASVWEAVVAAGAVPAGLGARDTLRLEAGLPLHGHELGPGITPDDAGLSWVVRMDKGRFRGVEALERTRAETGRPRLRGLLGADRRPLRAEADVLDAAGAVIGRTSSGSYSPVLERGIALAFMDPSVADGAAVTVDVRGRPVPATVTKPPFVRRPPTA